MRRASLFLVAVLAASAPAKAAIPNWQIAGKTYNSVAFVDVNSIVNDGRIKSFTAIRVSGQPQSDRWRSVVQRLRVDCFTRMFDDGGSRIEKTDGTVENYPASGASQRAVSRGVFFDMYQIVCGGREGSSVVDPQSWTLRNFKPGD